MLINIVSVNFWLLLRSLTLNLTPELTPCVTYLKICLFPTFYILVLGSSLTGAFPRSSQFWCPMQATTIPIKILINYIVHGYTHNFFCFFSQRSHVDWPISKFLLNIGHAPIETSLLDPSCKIETNVLSSPPPGIPSLQFIYMGVELWANHMG